MRTLTSPSRRLTPLRIAIGKRSPIGSAATCASTYGWVGADPSLRISHCGARPWLVMLTVHSGGVLPSGPVSKLITFPVDANRAKATVQPKLFMQTPGRDGASLSHPYLHSGTAVTLF